MGVLDKPVAWYSSLKYIPFEGSFFSALDSDLRKIGAISIFSLGRDPSKLKERIDMSNLLVVRGPFPFAAEQGSFHQAVLKNE